MRCKSKKVTFWLQPFFFCTNFDFFWHFMVEFCLLIRMANFSGSGYVRINGQPWNSCNAAPVGIDFSQNFGKFPYYQSHLLGSLPDIPYHWECDNLWINFYVCVDVFSALKPMGHPREILRNSTSKITRVDFGEISCFSSFEVREFFFEFSHLWYAGQRHLVCIIQIRLENALKLYQ